MATPAPPKTPYILPSDAVFFITGCSSGLGLALARLIAAHPTHRLVATARDPSSLASKLAAPTSSQQKPQSLFLPLDVTSPSSIASALQTVLSSAGFGRIDVLINNAGNGLFGDTESSLPQHAPEEHAKARAVLDTNFWGVANLSLHAMQIMREENALNGQQGGIVVQIGSMAGFVGFPGNAYYHAAKFAVEGFTESVSREVRPEWNIHFTIAEPGCIDTNYFTASNLVKLTDHPAYDAPDSPGRLAIAYVHDPEFRKSWTKPEAMAKAIYEVVSRGKQIPLRFPLGRVAWQLLRAECDTVAKAFDDVRELSVSVDTNDQQEYVEEIQKFV